MGALNSIPLCSKSSTGPVLELDDDDKLPGSDANNNTTPDTVVTQPISSSIPEATSTPAESHSSIESSSDGELEDIKDSESEGETLPIPTLDRAIVETTHDSGLDDAEDEGEETSIPPSPTSEDEEGKVKEGSSDNGQPEELERPLSPTPPDNESKDRIIEKESHTDAISNLLDDIISGSDSTNIIEPIR